MIDFYPFLKPKIRPSTFRPVCLLVLDGWGVAPSSHGNAIAQANTPNMNQLLSNFPHGLLIASGESVGLPANEVGNTEVGHLTMGAGRVILQDLKKINLSIYNRSFYENKAFLETINHAQTHNSRLHIMGLIGSGNVHSSIEHLYGLIQLCKIKNLHNVCFHLFTDGRDSPPQEAIKLIPEIERRLAETKVGVIASISGRYWAMDRDGRWERTEKVYKAIVEGIGNTANSAAEAIKQCYERKITDEFIEPTLITNGSNPITIDNNDAIIFYNFRIDRPRQLTMAFVLPAFETLKVFEFGYAQRKNKPTGKGNFSTTFQRRKIPQNIFFTTMTEYQKNIPVNAIAFPPEVVQEPLGEVLSQNNMHQMHLAESEKERFVTYYFNGVREGKFPNEDTLIVPSPKVATYDKKPQMSVFKLELEFERALAKGMYHFFVMNFANPDMVAHTGNIQATIKALEATDKAIGRVVEAVLSADGTLLLTADHGNAEELLTFPTQDFFFTTEKGSTNTDHSNNPVPFILINKALKGHPIALAQGDLSDIAPTILAIMNIPKPANMSGRSLLDQIKL